MRLCCSEAHVHRAPPQAGLSWAPTHRHITTNMMFMQQRSNLSLPASRASSGRSVGSKPVACASGPDTRRRCGRGGGARRFPPYVHPAQPPALAARANMCDGWCGERSDLQRARAQWRAVATQGPAAPAAVAAWGPFPPLTRRRPGRTRRPPRATALVPAAWRATAALGALAAAQTRPRPAGRRGGTRLDGRSKVQRVGGCCEGATAASRCGSAQLGQRHPAP
jgi:hypothetical protein